MSYLVLARRLRPKVFEDVVGHDAVDLGVVVEEDLDERQVVGECRNVETRPTISVADIDLVLLATVKQVLHRRCNHGNTIEATDIRFSPCIIHTFLQ